ncbi:hypothetical protein AB0G60_34585 [Streptomyces angustmyceticus]|uniref:Uncharacterized protein n=1 Tax=Streptomyces angustmyceticus TaxID=285578 RepID=A0A5J4LKU7_9ACTN|nr:hypothetical protein [Streptomyces angustmyceticus]UAL70959.1 hypothetical protein K7396_34080 [Streptomyces angustmyceticus]GES34707.1 hypothetical protein San01_71950 [Streptomyces angustmyceticus]
MHRDKLGIYLNDHLAGATFGIGLAKRIAHQHRHSARSTDLQRIADEIAQDRQSLLEVMDTLGVPARHYKIYGGWTAERLGRLKPNGALYRRSGLSTLIELEALRLGVEGKSLIWRTLLVVAAEEPRLDESQLHNLLDRARGQIETLEALRLTATAAVFSPAARSTTPDNA